MLMILIEGQSQGLDAEIAIKLSRFGAPVIVSPDKIRIGKAVFAREGNAKPPAVLVLQNGRAKITGKGEVE